MAAKLSSRHEEVKDTSRHAAVVQEWANGRLDDELVWTTRPLLHRAFGHRGSGIGTASALATHAGASLGGRRGPSIIGVGEIGFFLDTHNQRRVLQPVMTTLSATTELPRQAVPSVPPALRRAARSRRAVALARSLHSHARRAGDEVSLDSLVDRFLGSARALARAEAASESGRLSTVVVSSQHNANARALLWVAARDGIRSVYIPHTAGSRLPEYRDLPCNLALLRGRADREHYERLGADTAGLLVSGNPSVEPRSPGPTDLDLGPVLALSPDAPADVAELVAVCAEAWPRGIIAAHPRSDRAQLAKLLPDGWTLHEGSTFDLLVRRPFAVVQCSSGVGWEALSLGLPVVQLAFPGRVADYFYLDDPVVDTVSDSDALRAAIERARAAAEDGPQRRDRVALATRWCVRSGQAAAEHMAGALLRAPDCTPEPWLLDGWRSGAATEGPAADGDAFR